jgi:chemotaxis protein histidine kinase CheA
MTFTDDAELREIFQMEIAERADRLVEGARAFVAGSATGELAHDLFREGHTIKGTARIMGFIALSDAGKLLEDIWRRVDEGEIDMTPGLAASLEQLSCEIMPAVDGDPEIGTPALAEAVQAVEAQLAP